MMRLRGCKGESRVGVPSQRGPGVGVSVDRAWRGDYA